MHKQNIQVEQLPIQKNKQRRIIFTSKMSVVNSAQQLITNIIEYSNRNGKLLQKYNLEFYLNYFDRTAIMNLAGRVPPHQPLTQQDFIRTFLLQIEHQQQETLYLAMSLKQLFFAILERTSISSITIELSDFTNYLCEKISKEDLDVVIPAKRARRPSASEVLNEVDIKPPVVVQKVGEQLPKICKDMPKKNKKVEEKKGVAKMFFSKNTQKIIALGTLSSSIFLYDKHLKQQNEVRPKECRQMQKEVGILSMSYCQKYNRIGAILTSGMMVFWQGSDNFSTQKNIPLKMRGSKIFYLNLLEMWVTVDSQTLYFWNLKEEQVTNTIVVPKSASILDICQLQHLKSICVSVMTTSQQKLLVIYQAGRKKATIDLGNSACHTLHYNKLTQSLVPLGYTNVINVYTVQGQFDAQLKFTLRGHKSIITCVDSLEHNTLMATGDDTGQIRIWELTYMRCIQSLKLTKWLGGIRFIGNQLLYSDSRINILKLEHFQRKVVEKENALFQYYDGREEFLWVFTKKQAKKIHIKNGRIDNIFVLCSEDDEISAGVNIGDGFVVGNTRGELQHYNSDCNVRWTRQGHEGEVRQIMYDSMNRLMFSLGADGRIIAWPERNTQAEQERKTITFRRRQVGFMKLSTRNTLLAVGNFQDKQLTIWNYQILGLLQVLEMEHGITAVAFSDVVQLLAVATSDNKIYLIKYAKKINGLELTNLHCLDLNQSGIRQQIPEKVQGVGQIILTSLREGKRYQCVLSTGRGVLVNFDITMLVLRHFHVGEMVQPKESVNILRNQRQEFQACFSQKGTKDHVNKIPKGEYDESNVRLVWAKKISQEGPLSISKLGVKEGTMGVLCQDYSKIVRTSSGQIQTSLNIGQPLPIKWNKVRDNNSEIKKDIYQTLKMIDGILRNHGYEMLAKEYRKINVTPFMDLMKKSLFIPKGEEPVQESIVCDKRASEMGQEKEEPTLKALEAYKRVKAIKKMSEESMKVPQFKTEQHQAQMDRDNILQQLSNHNYKDFISNYNHEKDPYISNFSNKLDNSLLMDKKGRNTKQTEFGDTSRKRDRKSLRDVRDFAFREVGNMVSSIKVSKNTRQKWEEKSESKNIREILGDLNGKLKKCRLKHNKQYNLQA